MKKLLIYIFFSIIVQYFLFPVISIPDRETIKINEMKLISLNLFQIFEEEGLDGDVIGYQILNGNLSKLPIGSTLDVKRGIFYWLPGPGFLGDYEFVFKSALLGQEKRVKISILPRHGKFKEFRIRNDISTAFDTVSPFGSFDTPASGANVSSSISVTGWALDDVGIVSVKIYILVGDAQVYIGDALLVEGARPDVAAAYPGYPGNTRAGWGYMLLTNFLPGGDGTFQLQAVAADTSGNIKILGTKTINVDNANAVKPFGAIDTPTQGGTASGSAFKNQGWVLTPQPNSIPTDGSTIKVFVDGVFLGNPVYNIFRSDIAGLFPGYANGNGAAGYFNLDTTGFANGVHTIQWAATDSGGNIDGIGSRYFSILNLGIRWQQIPAGNFKMGDNFNVGFIGERPVHNVYIDKFYMSRHEVTHVQYIAFLNDAGVSSDGTYNGNELIAMDDPDCAIGYTGGSFYFKGSSFADTDDTPVIEVTWYGADEFCKWLSVKTGDVIRLPTEAEWEKAARGIDQRKYPWGNTSPNASRCNYNSNIGKTQPVGSYPLGVSPYGIHDMAGNVYEWCSDWFHSDYYSSSPTNNPTGPSSGSYRVFRGGGWYYGAYYVRSAYRDRSLPSSGNHNDIGFRLSRH